jgi:hypothetical protein
MVAKKAPRTKAFVCSGVVVMVGVDAITPDITPLMLHHQPLEHGSRVCSPLQVYRLLVYQERQLLVVRESLSIICSSPFNQLMCPLVQNK